MIKINRRVLITQRYCIKTKEGILCVYMCVCVCVCVYIYIYIEKERVRERQTDRQTERERESSKSKLLSKQVYKIILSDTEKSVLHDHLLDCFCICDFCPGGDRYRFLCIKFQLHAIGPLNLSILRWPQVGSSVGLLIWIPQVHSSSDSRCDLCYCNT